MCKYPFGERRTLQKSIDLKTLFHIESADQTDGAQVLLLEVGDDHVCYAILQAEHNRLSRLKYFGTDEFEVESAVAKVLEELQDGHFSKVLVCSAFPEAMLTPFKFAKTEQILLSALYDEPGQMCLSDNIGEWQMVNNYTLSQSLFEIITQSFPAAHFIHCYTPALKIYNGLTAEDQISIHFSTHYFRVLVKKSSQVMLVQTYSYKTPLDVVYYLLKICSELGLSQADVYIHIAGLIEEDSALYKELHHYFLNLHFAQPHEVMLQQDEFPQHFFTSFYNLAACAL